MTGGLRKLAREKVILVNNHIITGCGILCSFLPRLAYATNGAIISAPNVVNTLLGPGSSVTFAINVSNVGPVPEVLSAWQLYLHLNATLLKITQVIEGPALSDVAAALGGNTLFTGKFNSTTGLVQTDDILVSPPGLTDVGMVGNGTLVYVKANVLAHGTTDLVLNNTKLFTISGTNSIEINHIVVNGVFSNVPYNIPPLASFTAPSKIVASISARFDASASYDPDGSIVKYSWNFGDGNTTSVSVPTIDHTYPNPGGPIHLNLTVTDNGGATGSASVTFFVNGFHFPPVAVFTFAPSSPRVGETVTFNGTGSYDPNPGGSLVGLKLWNFGDGGLAAGPILNHIYDLPGTYAVTLTVQNNYQLYGNSSRMITITAPSTHDVGIVSIYPSPGIVVSGQSVNINVELVNRGTFDETVDLSVYYDSNLIQTLKGIFLSSTAFQYPAYFNILWDTTGVPPGNYTISGKVLLPTDQFPADNSLTDGHVRVLPPPILTLTPSSGVVGTKVTLRVSNLPGFNNPYQASTPIFVSFDDMFIGYSFTNADSSNFTFDVPLAQPGVPHSVNILALLTGTKAKTGFQVLPGPSGNLVVTVEAGSVYFPGDTANIFVLTTLNGVPAGRATYQQSLVLFMPDGNNITLTGNFLSSGLYQANYQVPASGSGTYIILATVQINGFNPTSVATFEVKPSWISSHGRIVASAFGSVGLAGALIVGWKKGYFRRKPGQDETFPL